MLAFMTFGCLSSFPADAQYYYRDIISSRQAAADMLTLQQQQIKSVKISTFENDGKVSEDFFCERKISKDYKKSSLYTRTSVQGISLMESYFDEKGQLVKTYDSSDLAVRTTTYRYDDAGHLTENVMHSKSMDDDFVSEMTMKHHFLYNEKGTLQKMFNIKNHTDSSIIIFSADENNNIIIEKNDRESILYYYYYDEKERLTDVVHAVPYKEKLVADYLFEYAQDGMMKSMTTTKTGQNDYTVWHYEHLNGLKQQETAVNKDGKIIGKITYEYRK
jgi:YD repeat-containing protein